MVENRRGATTPKEVAKYILDELGVSRRYVLDFDCNNKVYLFDNYDEVTLITSGSDLCEKIKQIEKDYNVLIYAVTHDFLELIGETYTFLCISSYPEDWDGMLSRQSGSMGMVYAYVQNVANDLCSEFGYVVLQIQSGKIKRVG